MEFQVTKNASVFGLNKSLGINEEVCIDVDNATTYVKFDVEIEARSWGIKDIVLSVTKVTVEVDWEVQPDELNETDIAEIKVAGGIEMRSGEYCGNVTIESGKDGWEIVNNHVVESSQITIGEVEIDLNKKIITVS